MSTYKSSDGCTDTILDFIAGGVPGNPDGESTGNYNAVIGDSTATDDLAHYTLDEIYGLMDALVAGGQPSTAVGRYQIIRSTLESLQSSKRLAITTKFTPELQDQLAVTLMVERGYSKWWAGKISNAEFAHGLSCEWASLPDPDLGGKSHYDGVGENHAGTTLSHVYDALNTARIARDALVAGPAEASGGGFLDWLKGLFG